MWSEWKAIEIGTLCEGIFDGPHATQKKTSHGPIFLGISCLDQGRIDLFDIAHLSEDDFKQWTRLPLPDDIVFSYETRLGSVGIIPYGLRCCLGRRMALMRPNRERVVPRFLLYAFIAPFFQDVIRRHTIHGSTVNRIPLLEFPRFPIQVPPLPTQHRIAVSVRQNRRLARLRDTLLPKLLSGELEVPDAEKFVESTV